MKTLFVCYNYLTLYKSIDYIQSKSLKADEYLILYRSNAINLDEEICGKINIINIKNVFIKRKGKVLTFINQMYILYKFLWHVTKNVKRNNFDNLVVFKDNEYIEATIIDKFKSLIKNAGEVILIEEGIGLYQRENKQKKNNYWEAVLLRSFGVSSYIFKNKAQGYNLLVDKIICSMPNKLKEIKGREELTIVDQGDIYNKKSISKFMGLLGIELGSKILSKKYNYVYLTQPLNELNASEVLEEKMIKQFLDTEKNVIMKRHPRDNKIRNMPIDDFPKNFNKVPFECLFQFLDNPVVVTICSSAYKNILLEFPDSKIILLYKLLNNSSLNQTLNEIEHKHNNGVFVPENFEQLKSYLNEDINV